MISRLVAQQFDRAKSDNVTQNTPPLVAARLLGQQGVIVWFVQRRGVWQCGIAVSPSTTRRLTSTSSSSRRMVCAPWGSGGSFGVP